MKRKFIIDLSIYGEDVAQAWIELDQAVIDNVDDGWRENFYNYDRPEQIAEHIFMNMFENHLQLSQMDGFANLDNSLVRITHWPHIPWGVAVKELT